MRRYGIISAILTILEFWRFDLQSKEAVKQQHLDSRKGQLERDNGKNVAVRRIISEDSELLYTSLKNLKRQPKEEYVNIFSTRKLTEEALTLLENRNREYLNTFYYYGSDGLSSIFDRDMKKIKKSSDPESIFNYSYGYRNTIFLHVSLKSIKQEMKKKGVKEECNS